ncbi:MAG: DUF5054 domain-containing protein [Terrimicrobiaceae bacterium]
MKNSSRVLAVFKTHLDIGFTDFASGVVRRYVGEFIPVSLRLAKETRHSPHRFTWTTGSWLAYRFLEDAARPQRKLMEEAIENGDFHWHALPFTMHSELMDPRLFRLGLRFSKILDERFGRKTISAKTTDVPGHTKGIVPLLAAEGIRLLHMGTNPACPRLALPRIFNWKVEGSELVVVYDHHYGGMSTLPGGMVLSMHLTSDNLGPLTPQQVAETYAYLQELFPSAQIVTGSMDEAAAWAWARRKSLPEFTGEIGDTWIHGAGSDPSKISRFLELGRLRGKWLDSGMLKEGGPQDLAFGENLLLVAEHTWGLDIASHLKDERNYSPADLRRALRKPNFRKVEKSWLEQRAYIPAAIRALPPALRPEAENALAAMKPAFPKTVGTRKLRPGDIFQLGRWEIGLDARDGSIRHLKKSGTSHLLADSAHRLAGFLYQTFSAKDVGRYYRRYCTIDAPWVRDSFTKPGLPAAAGAGWHHPRVAALRLNPKTEELVAELRFGARAQKFGAPAKSAMIVSPQDDGLDIRLQWFQKPANRMPEAFWFRFQPRLAKDATVTLSKLGLQVDPREVAPKGGRHLHAANGPVRLGGLSIHSLDAPVVAPGKPELLDFTQRQPGKNAGVFFNLFNNTWGTNFVMWYSDDAGFRFTLRWDK